MDVEIMIMAMVVVWILITFFAKVLLRSAGYRYTLAECSLVGLVPTVVAVFLIALFSFLSEGAYSVIY
jgi:hypothetical protein